MAGKLDVGAVASVEAKFSRQQTDKSKPRPLTNAKGLEQLSPRVFHSEGDRVHGGDWQRAPRSANVFSSKVLRIAPRSKSTSQRGNSEDRAPGCSSTPVGR